MPEDSGRAKESAVPDNRKRQSCQAAKDTMTSQPSATDQSRTAANSQRDTAAPVKPSRGLIQRFLRSLRRPRNGDQLRDTIGELLDDTAAAQAAMVDERQLIHNILQLHELTAHDVMVPRADIVSVDVSTSLPALIRLLNTEAHSRLPVYRGTLDEIIGMVHIKDVLPFWSNRRAFRLEKIVRKTIFAAPSMNMLDLLAEMRNSRVHMALVVDEYGGIDGLVTIEDLVEEIVGEIEDEHDDAESPKIKEIRPGIAEADARATIEDLEEIYGGLLTEEERDDVDTIGGLVIYLANRVPSRGELIPHSSGLELEVLEADPRRIRRVRLRRLPENLSEDVPVR